MSTLIVVGMSGGVDSSVAAALLAEAGADVVGVTLRLVPWAPADDPVARFGSCCGAAMSDAARVVARQLGIPHYVVAHEREFGSTVIADFVQEYRRGRTPSPCVVCNRAVKFGSLLRCALAWGAEAVATGHYARRRLDAAAGRVLLCTGRDLDKDQSYFLWPLSQAQLDRARFPLGELTKAEVRALARARRLQSAETPESQELCFVAGDYRDYLRLHAPEAFRPGPVLDETGQPVGSHRGLGAYTVGQRRGLGLAGPWARYVLRLDALQNAVIVGPRRALARGRLVAEAVNLIALDQLAGPLAIEARIRHRAPRVPARIEPLGADRVTVEFAAPQAAVSPGQSVVFYDGDVVVGGGIIAEAA
jgi:tRNA-specific 2-thiouridylase